ncbi:MAG: hypothetical protein RLP09_14790 [Sandaracinaceae bacterium]|nr:hypothetical protein [Myxococcales bacterium]
MNDERKTARERALRAARAMSIAAALALGASGCSMTHDRGVDSGIDPTDGAIADSGIDSGVDSGTDVCADIEFTGECCMPIPEECCGVAVSGDWIPESSCCATCIEGPLTPPSAPV